MQVWIVWSDRPLAAFSSETRARTYIEDNKAEKRWACCPANINPEASAATFLPVQGAPRRMQASAAH
ncbi:hypothetical protein ABXR19_12695 [Uliginosibacterium flavum]|uniref:Uncharacterized protein n=2 Tax=Uliginosibacterium flavum TaxID=1396831 RepID=A0ABV2TM95_9RHOO